MTGIRPLAVLTITAMLAACAGTSPDVPDHSNALTHSPASSASDAEDNLEAATTGYAGYDEPPLGVDAVGPVHPSRYDARQHYHQEPSPGVQHAAEAALLLTGSAFLCTFVVVVLDGACDIGASFGYYYY